MEQDPDSSPTFWFQAPPATNRHRKPPIDPVVLIILIPILALIFLFFFLPPFLTHASHILKPGSVKSTWDSINIFLVIFAILCGVLARQNDDGSSSSGSSGFATESNSNSNSNNNNNSVHIHQSSQWVGFSDPKVVTGGLRRNSSSYPNLRHESVWENVENQNRNRFFDDFNLYSSPANRYYTNLSRRAENLYPPSPDPGEFRQRSRRSEVDQVRLSDEKEIFVDTFEVIPNKSSEYREQQTPTMPPPPPPPPPPPTRSATSGNSKRHSFQSVAKNVKNEVSSETESEVYEVRSYTSPPPPPPPPPPAVKTAEVKVHRSRHKHKKLERKVSDATKEIATAISSLYNQRKKKTKRKLKNASSSSDSSPPSVHSVPSEIQQTERTTEPSPPPPPPPPPPPHYRFHNLFKKGGKHKKIHSVPTQTLQTAVPPPPPLPPPPSSIFNNLFKSVSKSKRFHSHSTPPAPPPPPPLSITNRVSKTGTKSKRFNLNANVFSSPPPPPPPPPMTPPRFYYKKQVSNRRSEGKPPLPTKRSGYHESDEFLPSGSQSPLIPMPPPPPPPFKVTAMKFEVRGDFVRVRSTHSSVCSSPDRDDVEFCLTGSGSGSGYGPGFFPSPDVNAKAESFISRLKDEWRMEKKNYGMEKMG